MAEARVRAAEEGDSIAAASPSRWPSAEWKGFHGTAETARVKTAL
jgi:hypothetical protein